VHWIVPVIALVPFGWGNLLIYISTALYVVDTYAALTAASAIAANGLLRYIFGATFPLFTVQSTIQTLSLFLSLLHPMESKIVEANFGIKVYESLGIDWATSLLGFLSLAMLPIPWGLYKWGAEIRARSKFETNHIPDGDDA
jgi:hypothetical protein